MRRVAIVFAILLIFLQPRGVDAPRGLIGLFGETAGAYPVQPEDTFEPPLPLPSLTLKGIFFGSPTSLKNLDPRKITTLLATGDVIPARSVNYEMTVHGDFTYPFLQTYKYTRAADITLINLESPLMDGCAVTNDGMTFCGDPRVVQGLK